MTTWKTTMLDADVALSSVLHLLLEQHSDAFELDSSLTIDKKTVNSGDSNGNNFQKTLKEVNNILRASLLLDNESAWERAKTEEPSSSTVSVENQAPDSERKTIRVVSRIVVPSRAEWVNHMKTGEPVPFVEMVKVEGDLEGKIINPESLHQVLRKHSITPFAISSDRTENDGTTSSTPSSFASVSPPHMERPPRHHSPIPQFFEQPRANDPFLFHTNAYDSPPPSPGHEAQDYEYNMRADPNGAIPDFIEVGVQENNNTEREHKHCYLSLCDAFHHLLQTTPENVADKQNVLKELLHHSDNLIRKALERCPEDIREELAELAASIVLINNSLQRTTDYQSYKANSGIVQRLVFKVKTAIQKFM